jgi:hypothetical protein
MVTATHSRDLILGEVAAHYGLPTWKIQRLFERRLLPAPRRVGRFRVVSESDLPAVEVALRQAGYLPEAVAS